MFMLVTKPIMQSTLIQISGLFYLIVIMTRTTVCKFIMGGDFSAPLIKS